MSKYDYIQEFSKGGRISPEASATSLAAGTLGVGINGNLWIIELDKNGRPSWKPTQISQANSPYETVKFKELYNGILFIFSNYLKYNYYYNNKNSYVWFEYPDGTRLNVEADFNNIYTDFNFKFDHEKYKKQALGLDLPHFEVILSQVSKTAYYLKNLVAFNGLRNNEDFKGEEEEDPKDFVALPSTDKRTWNEIFKIGDKVKIRWDFSTDRGNKLSRVEYNSNENLFTITKREEIIDFKRIENPSGFLYTFNNGQTWEGKDLELVYRDEEKTPAPKDFIESFEIGDKVKLPLTKKGLKLKQYMSVVWDNAIKNGEDFLVVNAVDGVKIILNNYLAAYEDNDGDYFNIKLDNIELYETSEKPLLPDKSKNITSKTTKAFYENNKYKLDKIDSNISIKFIQALEFLSQYEESGQDIYTQKNKTIADDLISRIKNLKKQ